MQEQIQEDLKQAMRDKDTRRMNVLRSLKTAITVSEKSGDKVDVIAVIRKAIKQRKDSIDSYMLGARPDLADVERQEQEILENYLPKQLTEDDVRAIVISVIEKLQATSKKQMGLVIKSVIDKTSGQTDNQTISKIASGLLA